MTPRQQRRFRQQFAAQVEQERNGAPIHPEIEARMTKPAMDQPLFQVVVTEKATKKMIAIAPMAAKVVAEELAATINRFVLEGRERIWSSAAVVPMTPISAAGVS